MFSLIILNFKRPDNVIKIINNIKTFKYIDEIIVSNGKLDTAIRLNDEKIVIYDDYNTINNIYRFIKFSSTKTIGT